MGAQRAIIVCALGAAIAVSGCGGGGSSKPAGNIPAGTTTAASKPSPRGATTSRSHRGHRHHAASAGIHVPSGWHRSRKPRQRNWPVPLTIAASFPVHRVSGDASCPYSVLRRMPPDGVYLLVAEFTRDRPAGIPPKSHLSPRGDLRHLDIRPSEVECWNGGPSGAKDFEENGRAFRVEILLGSHVSPERRRRALEALASFRP